MMQRGAEKLGYEDTKDCLFGTYDYKHYCTPKWPYGKGVKAALPPFFGLKEKMPILLGMLMVRLMHVRVCQNLLANATGNAAPPIIIGLYAGDAYTTSYLIASAFIVSGIATILTVIRFRIPGTNMYFGSGIVSIIGPAFAYIPVITASLGKMMAEGQSFDHAWGRMAGTIMAVAPIQMFVAIIPHKVMRRLFPTTIAGVAVLLIGINIAGTGFQYWGGGVFCAENVNGLAPQQIACQVPVPPANTTFVTGECYAPAFVPMCSGNGNVQLPFGSPQYLGIGALVLLVWVFVEIFGSPFFRNIEIMVAVIVAYIVAAAITTGGNRYVTSAAYDAAPAATFLWKKTFPLGFYAPAVLPLVVSSLVATFENVGAITSAMEVSQLPVSGPEHLTRIQGGLLVDGFAVLLSGAAGTAPSVSYCMNGFIAISRVASRGSGIWTGAFFILFGIFAKLSAFFVSIPDCLNGGLLIIIAAIVMGPGVRVLALDGFSRRNVFIMAISLAIGAGLNIVPDWGSNSLWNLGPDASSGVTTVRDSIELILSNGLTLGVLVAIFLHLVLPYHEDDDSLTVVIDGDAKPAKHVDVSASDMESVDEKDVEAWPQHQAADDSAYAGSKAVATLAPEALEAGRL